jgi:replicative DNA helicase
MNHELNTTRLPPHAPEAEANILGCCLNTPKESLPEAQRIITSGEHFYDLRHQTIWDALNSMPVDKVNTLTVYQKLKDDNLSEQIGGLAYLSHTQNDVAGLESQIGTWLEIVQQKHILRKLIRTCVNLVGEAYDCGNPTELLDTAERQILEVRPTNNQSEGIKTLVRQGIDKIEYQFNNPGKLSGLPTGLTDLDKLTDGIHGGEMVVIAGFPSTGKTALAVNIAVHNGLARTPVAIFSAEMRPVQLVVRSLCSESRVNFRDIGRGYSSAEDLQRITTQSAKIANSPIYIEPANRLTIGQVTAAARRLKQKHGIRMMVVDYIQLLQGEGDNREQEISNISKGLKAIALELDIPVLALSQLTDDGKLRESRAIGQDGDSVWMLANDGEWNPHTQPIKLRVEKCRDGETGIVNLIFQKTITRFENAARVSDSDVDTRQ